MPPCSARRRPPELRPLAAADPVKDIEPLVSSLGFFRMKSKALVGLARALLEKHGGKSGDYKRDTTK